MWYLQFASYTVLKLFSVCGLHQQIDRHEVERVVGVLVCGAAARHHRWLFIACASEVYW